MAAMMVSVTARSTSAVGSLPWNALRSTGGPAWTLSVLRGKSRSFFSLAYGGIASLAPHWATGMTGALVSNATRAAPVLPCMGHMSGSRVRVPSG